MGRGSEADPNKVRLSQLRRADERNKVLPDGRKMPREELERRAEALDDQKKRFAQLDPKVQLEMAFSAGCISVDEYARKRGIREHDPNIYRLQLKVLDEEKEK